jgi:hypothetical protein
MQNSLTAKERELVTGLGGAQQKLGPLQQGKSAFSGECARKMVDCVDNIRNTVRRGWQNLSGQDEKNAAIE